MQKRQVERTEASDRMTPHEKSEACVREKIALPQPEIAVHLCYQCDKAAYVGLRCLNCGAADVALPAAPSPAQLGMEIKNADVTMQPGTMITGGHFVPSGAVAPSPEGWQRQLEARAEFLLATGQNLDAAKEPAAANVAYDERAFILELLAAPPAAAGRPHE